MKVYLDYWRTYPKSCSVDSNELNDFILENDWFCLNELFDNQYEFKLETCPYGQYIDVLKNEVVVAAFNVYTYTLEDQETYYNVSFVNNDMCYQLKFKEVPQIITVSKESWGIAQDAINEPPNPTQALNLLMQKNKGYHLDSIEKGVNGELSKIQEELDELKDAEKQGVTVMQLVELSDLIGSIELYLEKHFPYVTLEDLIKMKDVTKRAFINGKRV